jgi:hypothetical protein
MKPTFRITLWLGTVALIGVHVSVAFAATNVAPTPVVIQAVQRPGTTFMDIDYRVNDPDDATVQTAALGFVDGGTNFSDIVRISTLVEGTAANIGSNTPANTQKRLTWNVAADWNTNFGNVQVEILAKDGRGLLPFHWITLPSNGPNPEITINDRPIYDADLLPLWYWLIAAGDPAVQLVNGKILGVGGNYSSNVLAQRTSMTWFGRKFLWERLNIHSLSNEEMTRAKLGRYGLQSVDKYSVAKGFVTIPDWIYGWGNNDSSQLNLAPDTNITAVALGGQHTLVIARGRVGGWGDNGYGQITIPASATNVVAIATGYRHSLALKADGTVVGWGDNGYGQATGVANGPSGIVTIGSQALTEVVAMAAGQYHSLALKADGTVVVWGRNNYGQLNVPAGLSGINLLGVGCCMANHIVVVDKRNP